MGSQMDIRSRFLGKPNHQTDDADHNGSALSDGFDPVFYLSTYPDIALAEVDPLQHYLTVGWKEGRLPNSWFDPEAYLARFPDLDPEHVNPWAHFVINRDAETQDVQAAHQKMLKNQHMYWTMINMKGAESPKPAVVVAEQVRAEDLKTVRQAFDADYYSRMNPEIAQLGVDPLLHFMKLGWIEGRDPSPEFSVSYYLRNNPDVAKAGINPFLHYLQNNQKEKWRKTAKVFEVQHLDYFRENSAMVARVEEACRLEPLVALPDQPRRVKTPVESEKPKLQAIQKLREAIGLSKYRYIVAIPHIRMSGASRVATILASALSELRNPDEILIVSTDSLEAQYAHWLPKNVKWLALAEFTEGLGPEPALSVFIDLLRGVQCEVLINANSRLAWDTLSMYGRQLSQDLRVVTYLFTWDETRSGARVGYPIQWLRHTANVHDVLLTDNARLAQDVSERMGYDLERGQAKVVALKTPVQAAEVDYTHTAQTGDTPRFLWAGRFDRQKRIDLLIKIASSNPDYQFDVYGAPVLDGQSLQALEPPPNIIEKGTYKNLSDVLRAQYTGFLYTAQWDGIPTILLDIGITGMPIVAPNVGGIPELIDAETGWLIDDYADISAFTAALQQIVQDPELSETKGAKLRERILTEFNRTQYLDAVREVFANHGI